MVNGQCIATFRGCHNSAKVKVFILLWDRKYRLSIKSGFTAREIHDLTGVNYNYLKSRLGKWHKWHYLTRRSVDRNVGRSVYTYSIAKRGVDFIRDRVPREKLLQCVEEINAVMAELRNKQN